MIKILKHILKKHPWGVVMLCSLTVMVHSLSLLPTLIIGKVVDQLILGEVETSLWLLSLFSVSVTLIFILSPFQKRYSTSLFHTTIHFLSLGWCRELLSKRYDFYQKHKPQALLSQYSAHEEAHKGTLLFIFQTTLPYLLEIIVIFAYLFYLGGTLIVMVLIGGLVILSLLTHISIKIRRPLLTSLYESRNQLMGWQFEILDTLKSIQLSGLKERVTHPLERSLKDYETLCVKDGLYSSSIEAMRCYAPCLGSILVLLVALRSQDLTWQAGDFVVMFILTERLLDSFFELLSQTAHHDLSTLEQQKFQDLLSHPNPTEKPRSSPPQNLDLHLQPFRIPLSQDDSEPEETYLSCSRSITIPQGSKVAIVGASGQGKTTLAHLMVGLISSQNTVFLGKRDIFELSEHHLLEKIYLEPHQSAFLRGNFDEAVMLGKNYKDSLKETLIDALGLDDLRTQILGETFAKEQLSTGEQKRLGLMRALLLEASITILDEPTEALDENHRQKVWNLLFSSFKNQTLICITHDRKVLTKFDQVISIKNHQLHSLRGISSS